MLEIYHRSQGGPDNWGSVKQVSGTDVGDFLGYSVDILADGRVAAGAPFVTSTGGYEDGAVLLFAKDEGGPGNWGEVGRLLTPTPDVGDSSEMGTTVKLSPDGNYVAATAINANTPSLIDAGRAHIFANPFSATTPTHVFSPAGVWTLWCSDCLQRPGHDRWRAQ